jgi:hypothetical protein
MLSVIMSFSCVIIQSGIVMSVILLSYSAECHFAK